MKQDSVCSVLEKGPFSDPAIQEGFEKLPFPQKIEALLALYTGLETLFEPLLKTRPSSDPLNQLERKCAKTISRGRASLKKMAKVQKRYQFSAFNIIKMGLIVPIAAAGFTALGVWLGHVTLPVEWGARFLIALLAVGSDVVGGVAINSVTHVGQRVILASKLARLNAHMAQENLAIKNAFKTILQQDAKVSPSLQNSVAPSESPAAPRVRTGLEPLLPPSRDLGVFWSPVANEVQAGEKPVSAVGDAPASAAVSAASAPQTLRDGTSLVVGAQVERRTPAVSPSPQGVSSPAPSKAGTLSSPRRRPHVALRRRPRTPGAP